MTQACLLDSKVRHEVVVDANGVVDLESDPVATQFLELEQENWLCCDLLSSIGCNVSIFKAKAPRLKKKQPLPTTEALSKECQVQLASASSPRNHFKLGRGSLSSKDYFIGKERKRCHEELAKLVSKKACADEFARLGAAAAVLMEKCGVVEKGVNHVKVLDLKEIIKGKVFHSKDKVKMLSKKTDLINLWNQHPLPASGEEWTDMDDTAMGFLNEAEIHLEDTAVGEEHSHNAALLVGRLATDSVPDDSQSTEKGSG